MKRKPLTIKQCRALFERQGGKCAAPGCEAVLVIGPKGRHVNFTDEHLVARGRGGSEALKNRALYCNPCAAAKTYRPRGGATTIGSDLYEIRKTKRLRAKRASKPKKHPWVSRQLSGAKRPWPSRKIPTKPMRGQ